MIANKVLDFLFSILSFVIVPVQIVTTFVLGLLVSLSFGILLFPFSVIWILLLFPMIGLSWITTKIRFLREPIGFLGIPWAVLAEIYVALTPSMGELEGRYLKLMLCEAWPYTWECWRFQTGKINLEDPKYESLQIILDRISRNNPLLKRVIDRITFGEPLDSDI